MGDLPPINNRKEVQRLFGKHALPPQAHAGLVFDRYLRCWEGTKISKPTYPHIKSFVDEFNKIGSSHSDLLAEVHKRLDALVSPGGRAVFKLQSRLASGLGCDHPLDNGFAFDRTVGVPFLSGSAVKGLCRAWADLVYGVPDRETLNRLFGKGPQDECEEDEPDEFKVDGCVGDIVFLSAYPLNWPELEIDIVNNHHQRYYSRSPSQRSDPLDVESPVPIHHLTVSPGTEFVFRFKSLSGSQDNVQRMLEILSRALEYLGIGAKTALGYGVMKVS